MVATIGVIYKIEQRYKVVVEEMPKFEHTAITTTTPSSSTTSKPSSSGTNTPPAQTPPETGLPKNLNWPVPFTPQAPTANWDELHNEACEEASSIMAYAYYSGMKDVNLKPEFVEDELAKITEWEKQTFGYYLDIDAEETARLLREFYGLKATVLRGYTEDQLKTELSQNHLVLLLANGRLLGNPNFRQPGPPYHMLVLRGYNGDTFITNDPGTRKGLNYAYSFSTLYNAGGDWSHTINAVDTGKKTVVIVSK